ncbi:DUF559 domain-containing protein [Naumannella halotolerans]|uniref:Very-short-patch-repair endonuclease n=1 Tax=Naumannella halotolerans TaxID=993414 RepID=A0A4R7J4F0_9ACTN|nr:DUF559 domain-containing protein [Naumannella halotolerans]TDT31249.1 very-short-patch-repair endonuclease [Naumannella halotolerans]
MHRELTEVLSRIGYVRSAGSPRLRNMVHWAARRGELTQVMRGVWVADGVPVNVARAIGLCETDGAAVLTGPTALALHLQRPLPLLVHAASPHQHRPAAGLLVQRRSIEPEHVLGANLALGRQMLRVRVTSPVVTAVDLASDDSGAAIDELLRRRMVTLAELEAVVLNGVGRRGQQQRRLVLRDSRDEPWSAAERLAHRLLRDGGITGWRTNVPIRIDSMVALGDIVFEVERLVVEIDGREHHTAADAFERDRLRQNRLILAGWRVLRFTWAMLLDHPALVIDQIRTALAD